MKIITVIGARPQFIKASVVSEVLEERGHKEILIHTGQHFDDDMSDVFFRELGLRSPDHFLGIDSVSHGEMTGRMLIALEKLIADDIPDFTLVYGDTNSTLAGALAASKLHVPVAHVEAGLRSFNMRMPEEINRVLTDRVSSVLFAPTAEAEKQLLCEGVAAEKIINVGDVMLDVAMRHGAQADEVSVDVLTKYSLQRQGYILVTIHRAENTDDTRRLEVIVKALIDLGQMLPVLMPLHPRTRGALMSAGFYQSLSEAVQITQPVGYLDMVALERASEVVVTDSGGVQKEAFFHKVPCVTLRDETEWTELVAGGWNRLVPPADASAIVDAVLAARGSSGSPISPYGHGHAAEEIVKVLERSCAR